MSERDERLLNDYLDGALGEEERAALEARLDGELRLLREYAALLEVVKAMGDLPAEARPVDPNAIWARIAERTGAGAGEDVTGGASVRSALGPLGSTEGRSGWAAVRSAGAARRALRAWRAAPTLSRLAATLVLAALSGAAAWLTLGAPSFGPAADPQAGVEAVAQPDGVSSQASAGVVAVLAGAAAPDVDAIFEGYETSTRVFDRVLEEGAATLSPETLDAVREALAVADRAIAEARRALEEDPGSEELARILFASMKRRLELLRSAAAVVQSAAQ